MDGIFIYSKYERSHLDDNYICFAHYVEKKNDHNYVCMNRYVSKCKPYTCTSNAL